MFDDRPERIDVDDTEYVHRRAAANNDSAGRLDANRQPGVVHGHDPVDRRTERYAVYDDSHDNKADDDDTNDNDTNDTNDNDPNDDDSHDDHPVYNGHDAERKLHAERGARAKPKHANVKSQRVELAR